MARQGNLFVISGPSGAGKGTLIRRLIKCVPDIWVSISATTRPPRKGEVDGRDYIFLTRRKFEDLAAHDGFLEWAEYDGNLYGTPAAPVREHIAAGDQVVLEIEVQGAALVHERVPECHMVFIEPPSLEVLEARLRGRKTNDEASIAARMETAKVELARKMEYDKLIVNDNLNAAAAELVAYVDELADKDCK